MPESKTPLVTRPQALHAGQYRPGKLGDKLAAGEVVLTASGRPTTPFPKIALDTPRKSANTLKAVAQWLMGNALAEARQRGDRFNELQFEAAQRNPQQADKDSAEEYLFGAQPRVVPSILRPLVGGSQPASVGALRKTVLEAIEMDALALQEQLGQLVVASSTSCSGVALDARSMHDADAGVTVLFADRFPEGEAAQLRCLREEIARWHGQEACQAVLGVEDEPHPAAAAELRVPAAPEASANDQVHHVTSAPVQRELFSSPAGRW